MTDVSEGGEVAPWVAESCGPGAPRWSVVIPVHNCARFLAEVLPEVVSQLGGRGDAEILVVDDASSDDPERVVCDHGGGRVRYKRNPGHLGAIGTFNRAVSLTRGEFVHLLHGDDLVRPGFYDAMESALLDHPDAAAAMCRTLYIDQDGTPGHETKRYREGTGVWRGALRAVVVSNRVRAPSIVVRRWSYARVGPYRTDLPHAADWDMWTRVLATGPLVFVDQILACYRRHTGQDTEPRVRSGENIRERLVAIGTVIEQVPAEERGKLARRALVYSSVFATRTAVGRARAHEWSVAAVQMREAARCLAKVPFGIGPRGG